MRPRARQTTMEAPDEDQVDLFSDEDSVPGSLDLADDAIALEIAVDKAAVPVASKKGRRKAKNVKRKKRSAVRQFFEATGTPGEFRCRLHSFLRPWAPRNSAGTSNLLAHARSYHQEPLDAMVKAYNDNRDVKSEMDGLLAAMSAPVRKNDASLLSLGFTVVARKLKGVAVQIALLVCIIANCLPFHLIDSPHFRDWMVMMGTSIPSCNTVTKLITPLYQFVVNKQRARLHQCGAFSITFDLWTSIASTKYLVVAYHALDSAFSHGVSST